MKVISKLITIMLAAVVLCSLIAAIGSAITKEPVLFSVIRSNSMSPVWERGDMVVIENVSKNDSIHNEDIVFFKTEEGSLADKGWIAHRVMGGNNEEGFITKGDANEYTDQESSGTGPIPRDAIAGRAVTFGETPIVIPKIGYLSLWMEKFQSTPILLPAVAIILALLIGVGELKSDKSNKKKGKGIELQLIYIIGGLTIAVIMGGTMLTSGQKLNLVYEVSEKSEGVLMGSDVGILKIGEEVSKPLSELNNQGFFPLFGTITTDDRQITLSHKQVVLSQGEQVSTNYTVTAQGPGEYESSIRVGLFYPFLPPSVIYFLAQKSYWLALAAVSIVPGLPLIAYPFLNGKMRRRVFKVIRKRKRKMQSAMPF
ncbi:signal peptidase I [Virgibacillus doumboii]|uniref:signal peptidase I n=1 Tax=Virgibacillus doumboii TaxID=2697503 RepID=UPI0013DFCF7C|nr:signal peptidase I [Virgibacillus doumboii]